MINRLDKVRRAMKRLGLDALLVSNPANIFYLSGFEGCDSLLVLTLSDCYILTDFRYAEEAFAAAKGFLIISEGPSIYEKFAYVIKKSKAGRVGFEPHYMPVRDSELLGCASCLELRKTSYIIERLRAVKDAHEIAAIKRSASIARKTLELISSQIIPGRGERQTAGRVNYYMSRFGADMPSFNTIVLSGPNSSLPHGRPSDRVFEVSDMIMVDFGARAKGYSSDLTRMFFVGKISKSVNTIYNIVKTAQLKAIEKIRPGVKISDIDKAARSYIAGKGFEKYFGHATGHGIGIDVHELPRISSKNNSRLAQGMVFSIEPGIYLPGRFGIRIEDMVMVTGAGCEVLTR
ncbi:MAG: Xaa-Pro peptidase family protein [Candidatus Omnitrophica bacterium]|nr:Xaa-Pro peptidase family protein [Candidatus Omnitrophota bacterium]